MNKEGGTHPLLYYIECGYKVWRSMAKQGKVRQGKAGKVKVKLGNVGRGCVAFLWAKFTGLCCR